VNQKYFLSRASEITTRSECVSSLYVGYCSVMLGSSLLGPGVCSLVLVGGLQYGLGAPPSACVFLGAVVPALYFAFCLWASPRHTVFGLPPATPANARQLREMSKNARTAAAWRQEIQISVGEWLSYIYALLIIAAVVGLVVQQTNDYSKRRDAGESLTLSVTTLFTLFISLIVLVTGAMHGEISFLSKGFVFILAIPATQIWLVSSWLLKHMRTAEGRERAAHGLLSLQLSHVSVHCFSFACFLPVLCRPSSPCATPT
jgi:hypothetical protein